VLVSQFAPPLELASADAVLCLQHLPNLSDHLVQLLFVVATLLFDLPIKVVDHLLKGEVLLAPEDPVCRTVEGELLCCLLILLCSSALLLGSSFVLDLDDLTMTQFRAAHICYMQPGTCVYIFQPIVHECLYVANKVNSLAAALNPIDLTDRLPAPELNERLAILMIPARLRVDFPQQGEAVPSLFGVSFVGMLAAPELGRTFLPDRGFDCRQLCTSCG
jgi:hypothetical protein